MDYCYSYCCCCVPEEPSTGCTCTSVSGANIDASGDLYMSFSDGTIINVGHVQGPSGSAGPSGPSGPSGASGTSGASGLGFTGATINSSGQLELTTTQGDVWNCGSVVGPAQLVSTTNEAKFQIPNGFNTFLNKDGEFAIEITLPVQGNFIGEVFTVSHQHSNSLQHLDIHITNTTMAEKLTIFPPDGGAAFVWTGLKWNKIT
jgi:hypothetical protein